MFLARGNNKVRVASEMARMLSLEEIPQVFLDVLAATLRIADSGQSES